MPKFDGTPYTQLTDPVRNDVQGVIKDISEALAANQTKFALLEDLMKFGAWASKVRTVTASASVTLANADPIYIEINPNGADRDVNLPAKSDDNHGYYVRNIGSGNILNLKRSGGAILGTLAGGEVKYVMPSTVNDYSLMTIGAVTNDGWILAGVTWTYASASTFTVSGDHTATYAKGTRIKWTQTTVKYGVVASSSYSAPNTTVTILVNTDYTIANAAISANYYSYVDALGFPKWFNYAPTVTGYSALPASPVYQYAATASEITVTIREPNGGSSNATTITYTLPATAKTLTNAAWIGWAAASDNTAALTSPSRLTILSAATTMSAYPNTSSASVWTASGTKSIAIGNITYLW